MSYANIYIHTIHTHTHTPLSIQKVLALSSTIRLKGNPLFAALDSELSGSKSTESKQAPRKNMIDAGSMPSACGGAYIIIESIRVLALACGVAHNSQLKRWHWPAVSHIIVN